MILIKVIITPLVYTNDFEKKEIEVKRLNTNTINKIIKELYGYIPTEIEKCKNKCYYVKFAYTIAEIKTEKSAGKERRKEKCIY